MEMDDDDDDDDLLEDEPVDMSIEIRDDSDVEDEVDALFDDELVPSPTPATPHIPPTMTYPVNEMEVVTNRGGRSGSLSKFLDEADLFRRRSLTAYNDDPLGADLLQQKKLTLSAFLSMAIDPILEIPRRR
ncbi:hypothetical protein PINS_up014436 [Pythium insidiosum]|nr:hypothetical protein PINS_up014436 [Pythium insidiosum]